MSSEAAAILSEHVPRLAASLQESELAARRMRGLPTGHVLTLDEFPFVFAMDEAREFARMSESWATSEPSSLKAAGNLVGARLALADYRGVDEASARLPALDSRDLRGSLRVCGPVNAPTITLPKVKHDWPRTPSLFISADEFYFEMFGVPLLRSIARHGAVPVHVHYLGKSIKPVAAARKIGVPLTCTLEDPTDFIQRHALKPAEYFNAIRLIRFADALQNAGAALFMMDIDGLVAANPAVILAIPGDIALRVRPARLELWNQFSACMIKGTPASLDYFRLAANIVHNSITTPWWGLDQFALFAAYVRMRPPISLIGPDVANVDDTISGDVNFTAGKRKDTILTDQGGFATLWRSYAT